MKKTIVLPNDPSKASWAVWLEQFTLQGGVIVYWAEAADFELLRTLSFSAGEPVMTRPSHKWIQDSELRDVQAEGWAWADVLIRLMSVPADVATLGNPSNWIGKSGQAVVLVAPFSRYADFCKTRIHSLAQTRPSLVSLDQCTKKVRLLLETTRLPMPSREGNSKV